MFESEDDPLRPGRTVSRQISRRSDARSREKTRIDRRRDTMVHHAQGTCARGPARVFCAPRVAMEEMRSPVGRPDFKSGRGRQAVFGGFDSHSLPPSCRAGPWRPLSSRSSPACRRPPCQRRRDLRSPLKETPMNTMTSTPAAPPQSRLPSVDRLLSSPRRAGADRQLRAIGRARGLSRGPVPRSHDGRR